MKPWHGLVLDVVVIVCVTILAVLKVVPGEAVLTIVGTLVGARAMQRYHGNGPGGSGRGSSGGASASASVALALALADLFQSSRASHGA